MRFLRFVFSLALLLAVAVGVLVYIGWYDIAADKPHAQATEWFIDQVRDRSVEVRARGCRCRASTTRPWCARAPSTTARCAPAATWRPARATPRSPTRSIRIRRG
jgi:hypothetical protein